MSRATTFLLGAGAAAALALGGMLWLRHRDHDRQAAVQAAASIDSLTIAVHTSAHAALRARREAEVAESAYQITARAYAQARGQIRVVHSIQHDTVPVPDTLYVAGDPTPWPIPLAAGLTIDRCDRLAADCAHAIAHADSALAAQDEALNDQRLLTAAAQLSADVKASAAHRSGIRTGVVLGAGSLLALRWALQLLTH